jgi:hypothetical protein
MKLKIAKEGMEDIIPIQIILIFFQEASSKCVYIYIYIYIYKLLSPNSRWEWITCHIKMIEKTQQIELNMISLSPCTHLMFYNPLTIHASNH